MTNVNKHGVNYSAIEVGDLVKLNMEDRDTVLGYVTYVDSHRIKAIWSDDFEEWPERFSTGKICGHWKVVVHEPKKLVPTKPYAQLVAYDYFEDGSRKWGVFTHIKEDTVFAYWCEHYPTWMPLDRIVAVEDIIIHEPKEQNLSATQELSVQQESANFAHAAVQGIINAHAIKLEEDILSELKETFTFDDFDSSVARTWKKQDFKDAVSNAALGLTGEAGEVADLIKKAMYHGRGILMHHDGLHETIAVKAIPKEDIKDELSDVLFYVSAMAQEFGFTLEDIAKHNREKLEKRFPEGFSTEASAQKKDKAYAKNSNVFN
nr:nucleoside triphosphate pyrophosphohydrolase family protein [Bacillus cereus]